MTICPLDPYPGSQNVADKLDLKLLKQTISLYLKRLLESIQIRIFIPSIFHFPSRSTNIKSFHIRFNYWTELESSWRIYSVLNSVKVNSVHEYNKEKKSVKLNDCGISKIKYANLKSARISLRNPLNLVQLRISPLDVGVEDVYSFSFVLLQCLLLALYRMVFPVFILNKIWLNIENTLTIFKSCKSLFYIFKHSGL